MRRSGSPREIPPPLELECLRVLWTLGEANVKDVREALTADRVLAYTTVLTILDRLAKKNQVNRRKVGRAFVYSAARDRETLRRWAVQELLDRYFDGSRSALLEWLEQPGPATASPALAPPEPRLDTTLL
jgi:predicted transcriptional regulator